MKFNSEKDFLIIDLGTERILVHDEKGEEIFYREANGDIDILTKRKAPAAAAVKQVVFEEGKYQVPDSSGWTVTEPSPAGLRQLLKDKGLSVNKAAEIVGVHSRTVRKWIGAERGIPAAAWKLLLAYRVK